MTDIPSPDNECGPPFPIGEHLTIWQAACVYVDRHPCDERFDDADSTARSSVEARERWLGARPESEGSPPHRDDDNHELALGALEIAIAARDHDTREVDLSDYLVDTRAERERRRTRQAVYRELLHAVTAGKIGGARILFCEGDRIDTSRTTIPTAALVDLARRRGDGGRYLSEMIAAAEHKAERPTKPGPKSMRDQVRDALAEVRASGVTFSSKKAAHSAVFSKLGVTKRRGLSYRRFLDHIKDMW